MIRTFSAKKEWVGVCLILLLLVIGASLCLQDDLEQENRLTAKRLAHAFIPPLTRAHHNRDDLGLQDAVSDLAQAPGIALACVADPDEKALAHNRLTQIGKTVNLLPHRDPLHTFPLKDGGNRWGTLVFSLSETSTHRLWLQDVTVLAGFALLLGVGYGGRLALEARRLKKLRLALSDQMTLNAEERRHMERLTQELANAQAQSRALIQAILEKLPEPTLLLDQRQRVAGFNTPAARLFHLDAKGAWDQLSWQDVAWLQDQGHALEHSLASPGMEIAAENAEQPGVFQTEPPWTWVTPRSALRAYR